MNIFAYRKTCDPSLPILENNLPHQIVTPGRHFFTKLTRESMPVVGAYFNQLIPLDVFHKLGYLLLRGFIIPRLVDSRPRITSDLGFVSGGRHFPY